MVSAAFLGLSRQPPKDLLRSLSELDLPSLTVTEVEQHLASLVAASGNRIPTDMTRSLLDRTHLPRQLDAETARGSDHPADALRRVAQALLSRDLAGAQNVATLLIIGRIGRMPSLVDQANAKGLAVQTFLATATAVQWFAGRVLRWSSATKVGTKRPRRL
ncbi:hypothetical protein ACRAWD_04595 [Caulobacter segnis]